MKFKLLLYLFAIYLPVFVSGKKIVVNPQNFQFLKAMEKVEAKDTILFTPGNYFIQEWKIDKPIVLQGQSGVIFNSENGGEIIQILANNVEIRNIKFKGVTSSYLQENSAIRIKKVKNFNIDNNLFEDCFFAIYLEKSWNGTISNNKIIGNAKLEASSGNGIHAWHCKGLQILYNQIEKQRDGIYFEFVDESVIKNNISKNNIRYGLHFMFSNDDSYNNNTFSNNGAGVAVMFSRRIKMLQNAFIYNWGNSSYGLLLKEIYDAEILENEFSENTTGIFVEGCNRVNYNFNTFKKNGWAFKFSGGCDSNRIELNNFIDNTMDMMVSSKFLNNTIESNYWSDYSGYDLNKDGVGDTYFYPVKLFNYILNKVPETVILFRSLFVDVLNYSEKVSPAFTPKDVFDKRPQMEIVRK